MAAPLNRPLLARRLTRTAATGRAVATTTAGRRGIPCSLRCRSLTIASRSAGPRSPEFRQGLSLSSGSFQLISLVLPVESYRPIVLPGCRARSIDLSSAPRPESSLPTLRPLSAHGPSSRKVCAKPALVGPEYQAADRRRAEALACVSPPSVRPALHRSRPTPRTCACTRAVQSRAAAGALSILLYTWMQGTDRRTDAFQDTSRPARFRSAW